MATAKEQVNIIFDSIGVIADEIEKLQKVVPPAKDNKEQYESWVYLVQSYLATIADMQLLAKSIDQDEFQARNANDSLEAWKKQSPESRAAALQLADQLGFGDKARMLDDMAKAEKSIPDSLPDDWK